MAEERSGAGGSQLLNKTCELIRRICSGEVGRLVITHKDRLLRFGSELVFSLCEHFGTEVVIMNASEEATFEEELVQDVLEIITVFSARLYGSRSREEPGHHENVEGGGRCHPS